MATLTFWLTFNFTVYFLVLTDFLNVFALAVIFGVPYCCRHTYITRLTALKVSPAMLQELAGHEDYETTLEYTHLSVADRLSEVNRLP